MKVFIVTQTLSSFTYVLFWRSSRCDVHYHATHSLFVYFPDRYATCQSVRPSLCRGSSGWSPAPMTCKFVSSTTTHWNVYTILKLIQTMWGVLRFIPPSHTSWPAVVSEYNHFRNHFVWICVELAITSFTYGVYFYLLVLGNFKCYLIAKHAGWRRFLEDYNI